MLRKVAEFHLSKIALVTLHTVNKKSKGRIIMLNGKKELQGLTSMTTKS